MAAELDEIEGEGSDVLLNEGQEDRFHVVEGVLGLEFEGGKSGNHHVANFTEKFWGF